MSSDDSTSPSKPISPQGETRSRPKAGSDDLFSLNNRVAIVTGALGLLGREHIDALASAGASVVVADLDEETCREAAVRLQSVRSTVTLGVGVDVTKPEAIAKLRDRTLEEFGHIDVLVNNAAINDVFDESRSGVERMQFEQYPLEHWKKMFDVNVTGTFLCSQIIGAVMARQKRGSIINIASTYGMVGPDQRIYQRPDGSQVYYKSPAYPATKGAVLAFTKFLASYWASSNVRVNCLTPGGVQDGQEEHFVKNYVARTPLGRMARPSDYRGALIFLASDASAYMTGANVVVDGGWVVW